MKHWFKIFKNETVAASSEEIAAELETLKAERSTTQATLTDLQSQLKIKRVEHLGGKNNAGEIKKLKAEQAELLDTVDTLDLAIEKLQGLHGAALEQERNAEVEEINRELSELKESQEQLTAKLLKAAGEAAAYFFLLRGGGDFTLGHNRAPLALGQDGAQAYFDRFNEIVDGDRPVPKKQTDLVTRRNALLGIKNPVNFLATAR